jgi:hypothetical protein
MLSKAVRQAHRLWTNPNIALTSYFMCAETDEACRRADGIPFFHSLRFYGKAHSATRTGTVNLWDEYEVALSEAWLARCREG